MGRSTLPRAWAAILVVVGLVATGTLCAEVRLGSEVLADHQFRELRGKRIGLLTNPSGANRAGQATVDVLHRAGGLQLVALFGPEHGVRGDVQAGQAVAHARDRRTGLAVHSLYGATRKPTPQMLAGLDALVYDLQDTGCRSYTFISSMGLAMEACAEAGIEFIVLDRPNPLGGERVEGPRLEPDFRSFVSQWDVPYLYGLTCGELARMINGERWITKPCRLSVIPMAGWARHMVWADTGLTWVPTSPNVRTPQAVFGYAATGIFGEIAGGSGATIGVGFNRAFECVVAPWLDGPRLAAQMNALKLSGLRFVPFQIQHRNTTYRGVELEFNQPATAPLVPVNLYLLSAIRQVSGRDLFAEAVRAKKSFAMFDRVLGTDAVRRALQAGRSPQDIIRSWRRGEDDFRTRRKPYLLYGDVERSPIPPPPATVTAVKPEPAPPVEWKAPPSPDTRPPAARIITIRRGDTMTRIARDHHVTISEIVEANPGLDADRIRVGQQIRIPPSKR